MHIVKIFRKMPSPNTLASIALIIFGLSLCASARAGVTAERITASNAGEYLSDTPHRVGGIGDWYLAKTLRVRCPLICITTLSGTPALIETAI